MKTKLLKFFPLVLLFASILFIACNKTVSSEIPANQQELTLFLTDGPGLFDNVYIDILSVKVLVDTSKNTRDHDNDDWDRRGQDDRKNDSSFVWETLNVKPGIYDVLKFRNGADTLLTSSTIVKGAIRLIKIELGTRNSLVKDSVTYPLNLPLGDKNYVLLKLKGDECEEHLPSKKRLWLDFDVTRSIVQLNNNAFYLKPVFHFFSVNKYGSVEGKIVPKESMSVLTLFNAKDTAYALPNKDGYFKLRGLKDGVYALYVNASNNYQDTTIQNIKVQAPNETKIGLIELHK